METAQVGDGVNWGEGVYWLDLEGPAQILLVLWVWREGLGSPGEGSCVIVSAQWREPGVGWLCSSLR